MTDYILTLHNGEPVSVFKQGTGFIPFDPANIDYAAYLRWLEEGNEPLPADEQPAAAEQPAED